MTCGYFHCRIHVDFVWQWPLIFTCQNLLSTRDSRTKKNVWILKKSQNPLKKSLLFQLFHPLFRTKVTIYNQQWNGNNRDCCDCELVCCCLSVLVLLWCILCLQKVSKQLAYIINKRNQKVLQFTTLILILIQHTVSTL